MRTRVNRLSPSGKARSCLARTSSSAPPSAWRSANSAAMSPSRSITETTRVPGTAAASSEASRHPRSQRADFRASGGLPLSALPSGQSNSMRGTPSGSPSPSSAKVLCMWIPSVPADPLVREMTPRPEQPPWVAKFRSVPSWTSSAVPAPRMRFSVRSRWAERIASGVKPPSSGRSIIR